MDWPTEGWTWAQASLDGSVPDEVLRQLIDASYARVYDPLSEDDKAFIALRDSRPTMEHAFESLLDLYRLRHRRDDILELRRPAIRLVTKVTAQDDIAPGQSRIGGVPDLPESFAWPAFEGKPMAFLAQLNLAEIPANVHLKPLPTRGLLYVFSMLGRMTADDDYDPDCCHGSDEPGLSQILYYDGDLAALTRRATFAQIAGHTDEAARLADEACRLAWWIVWRRVAAGLKRTMEEAMQEDPYEDTVLGWGV
jgi:hypothetical protein